MFDLVWVVTCITKSSGRPFPSLPKNLKGAPGSFLTRVDLHNSWMGTYFGSCMGRYGHYKKQW